MYAVLNMGYTPSQWLELNYKEKAFIMAAIKMKVDAESKANKKAEQNARKIRGRRK